MAILSQSIATYSKLPSRYNNILTRISCNKYACSIKSTFILDMILKILLPNLMWKVLKIVFFLLIPVCLQSFPMSMALWCPMPDGVSLCPPVHPPIFSLLSTPGTWPVESLPTGSPPCLFCWVRPVVSAEPQRETGWVGEESKVRAFVVPTPSLSIWSAVTEIPSLVCPRWSVLHCVSFHVLGPTHSLVP